MTRGQRPRARSVVFVLLALVAGACSTTTSDSDSTATFSTTAPAPDATTVTARPTTATAPDLEALLRPDELCIPAADGPHPAVVYLHGGRGEDQIGGAPAETCRALAEAGYVGIAPVRTEQRPIEEEYAAVETLLEAVAAAPEVEADRIGVLGFSRGGLLAYEAALEHPAVRALVLMATAANPAVLDDLIPRAPDIGAETLVLVAENDTVQGDHVASSQLLTDALEDLGKSVELVIYPPFGSDGHALFFELREEYWGDILGFLGENL